MTRRPRSFWAAVLPPMIESGMSVKAVAAEIGVAPSTVRRALCAIGKGLGRPKAEQEARSARMAELRRAGWRYDEIAAELGVGSCAAVHGVLSRRMTAAERGPARRWPDMNAMTEQERADYRLARSKRFSVAEALAICGRQDLGGGRS